MLRVFSYGVALALVVMLALPTGASAVPVVFTAAGANPAAIQATVDLFRTTLGSPDNLNAPGPLPGGRREINWDGGGATVPAPAGTPFAGFLNTRGTLFTTPGTGFTQSLEFPEINSTYPGIFQTFSPLRLFAPLGSTITDTTFFIPGTAGGTPAFVSGFGAIFTDVDNSANASITYFDVNGTSLGTFNAPAFNNGLSFLGVFFNAGEQVASVRIVSGNTPLGPNDGGTVDVIALDDFFFSEPQGLAIPEPTSLLLLGIGCGALVLRRCLRKRKSAGG